MTTRAGEETLHFFVEDVRLGGPPREKPLFAGEGLVWSQEEGDAVERGTLLVTDGRILLVPDGGGPPLFQIAARAVASADAYNAKAALGERLLGSPNRRANRRGSDFCGTAAAAATDVVLPPGSLVVGISGAEASEASSSFFGLDSHTDYHVSVRARGTSWVVSRRYSAFAALRESFAREPACAAIRRVPFPGKRPFGGDHGDRLVQLDAWVRAAARTEGCRTFAPFLEFLDERGANHFNAVARAVRDEQQALEARSPGRPGASPAGRAARRPRVVVRGVDFKCARFEVPPAVDARGLANAILGSCRAPPRGPECFRRDAVADEYARLGVESDGRWRVVDNASYDECPTYPALFAVPAALDAASLEREARHRSKRRVPALTWRHPTHGTALARSSQPHVAEKGSASEALAGGQGNECLDALRACGLVGSSLAIVDCRPYANALANAFKGGGFEAARDVRGGGALYFCGIANIHGMRKSLRRLRAACEAQGADFWADVAASEWLDHVRQLLASAAFVAALLHRRKTPTLVHCSDGWDRTSQVAALAQVWLDPYYRTRSGFCVLVDKDFLAFGHQFAKRRDVESDDRSPIFLQFLDAVYQLVVQRPDAFGFGEAFLLGVRDAHANLWHSTFYGDSDRERRSEDRRAGYVDAWAPLIAAPALGNAGYAPPSTPVSPLDASYAPKHVRLWRGCHL